ncbi:MAG: FAD-binding oxidoreductase [Chloroflexota bacterium]|nr:FAD-binding oxidoreductase [Chloroflexota bacterium]
MAYYLGESGLNVTVLDDKPLGSGCTLHGTGLVWKMIWNEKVQYKLAMEARDALFDAVPSFQERSGIDPQLHHFDTLMPIFNDEDMLRLERDIETSDGDIEVEWLDREDVLALDSRINPEVERGAFLKGSAQVDGYELARAQATAAKNSGVEFLYLRAIGLEQQGDKIGGVVHTGGKIPCENVVICMGAWSDIASNWLGFPVPIKPLKGETLRVKHPEEFPLQVSRPSGGEASPRKDGMLSVGATGTNRFSDLPGDMIRLEYDSKPTVEGREYMLSSSTYVIPSLSRAEVVYHLAGPRPLSADGMPIIGPIPGLDGAYVATGHRNKGIHLSALTGQIIRDFITTGTAKTRTPLERFLPQRFSGTERIEFNVDGVTSSPARPA